MRRYTARLVCPIASTKREYIALKTTKKNILSVQKIKYMFIL